MIRRHWIAYALGTTRVLGRTWSLPRLVRLVRRMRRRYPRLQAAYSGSPLRGVPLALALALLLPALTFAQENTVQFDPKQTAVLVATGPDYLKNGFRITDAMPDDAKVCVDDAMTRCVTVGEIRALASVEGEIGVLDQLRRELLSAQFLLTQANQRALQDQLEAWIVDLEKRHPGWTYDRQTGALVKAPPPTPEKKPGGGADE